MESSEAIPLFGVYDQQDYKMGRVIFKQGNEITYTLPDTKDGKYNLVLHKLLGLKVNETKYCKVRFITKFDAPCLGLYCEEHMELEQHVHMVDNQICYSPNNGQIQLKNPSVSFDLEVSEGSCKWRFQIRLLSNQGIDLPLARYAWVRLGKPQIDQVGDEFVKEIGEEKCEARYLHFLNVL